MADEPIQSSAAFRAFCHAGRLGKPLVMHPSVWHRYFSAPVAQCERRWKPTFGQRNRLGQAFKYEIGFTEKKRFPNAYCGWDGFTHHIVVQHLLPMGIYEFFNSLCSSPDFMVEVGEAQDEIPVEDRGYQSFPGFVLYSGEVKVSTFEEIVERFGPRDLRRQHLAYRLLQYAMEFVLEHEIGHAVNGHVHFLKEKLQITSQDEATLRVMSDHSDHRLILSFLEGMADKVSYFTVISEPLLARMSTPLIGLSSQDEHLIQEVQLKILAGACLALYWMIGDVLRHGGDPKAPEMWTDHPSSVARALAFVLMPSTQAAIMEPEIGYFVDRGGARAIEELLKQSQLKGIFKPFGWLMRKDMYSKLFEPNMLSKPDQEKVISELVNYRYLEGDESKQSIRG